MRTDTASRAEHGLGHVPPLDDGHGVVLHQLAEGEVGDLAQMLEAVQVGVQERGTAASPA